MISVEIVYAEAQRGIAKLLMMPRGALVADVLARAASDQDFAGVDLTATAVVGIFGKRVPRDQVLKEGDRIEIYRPLLEEPKLARRKRASRKASKSARS
ncbi:MAG TPA: RnfH family protein [Steroidobacteraceae bacterium]|jgi:hypothetical protein|nr:RnfH family protein [Steroidobacteraceae bacterium]